MTWLVQEIRIKIWMIFILTSLRVTSGTESVINFLFLASFGLLVPLLLPGLNIQLSSLLLTADHIWVCKGEEMWNIISFAKEQDENRICLIDWNTDRNVTHYTLCHKK